MSDGQRGALHPEFCRELRGFARDHHGRATTGLAAYFEILPADPASQSGADRFHGCFFCSETGSVALDAIAFALAVSALGFSEDSFEESLSKAFDGLAHARHFANVHTCADDGHEIVR